MDFCDRDRYRNDGRWIAEIKQLSGVMVYGKTRAEARVKIQALALGVLADRIEAESLDVGRIPFATALAAKPTRQ